MTRKLFPTILLLAALIFPSHSHAEKGPDQDSGGDAWTRGEKAWLLNGVGIAGLAAYGFSIWQYGERSTPHVNWEGGFGEQTKHGGMDKLGHAFTGYAIGRTFADTYAGWGYERDTAAWMGLGSSLFFTTMMEIGDSFSDFGLAPEDLVANSAGAAFGYLFASHPTLGRLFDFRLEYWPDNGKIPSDPITDYGHMKYHLVFKLSGVEATSRTWLRHFEVHAGYMARGFVGKDPDPERYLFLGIGLNLASFFDPDGPGQVFNYYQAPFTYYALEEEF